MTQAAAHRPLPLVFAAWAAGPLCIAAALLLAAAPSHAQGVQKCRVDGRVVFQAGPCSPEGSANANVATAGPAAAKKRTLADVLRERDGNAAPAPLHDTLREPQSDGASVLRARMGAV